MVCTSRINEAPSSEVISLLFSLTKVITKLAIAPRAHILVLMYMKLALMSEGDISLILLTRESEPLRIESQLPKALQTG